MSSWMRRQAAGIVALAVLVGMYLGGQLPAASSADVDRLAEGYAFTPYSISVPGGSPTQTIREVSQDYQHLEAWMSSIGAGIAMNDLDGDGLANDLCISEPRIDEVVITPTPDYGSDRYEPFVLDPAPLPMDPTMAPLGCVPGDFNADGRMDLLVHFWERTPIIFLARDDQPEMTAQRYRPVEVVDAVSEEGRYTGPQWNTTTVVVADLDGDGYEDLVVGNYFPDGPVLDPTVTDSGVEMPSSFSFALNGGASRVYRRTGGSGGPEPSVTYEEAVGALEPDWAGGWIFAAAAADLDGDLLPELYLAHDFGPDRLLYNRSEPGNIEFSLVEGAREPLVPKSKVVGHDSFKGMAAEFADMDRDGLYDILVGNITTSYGIQESNFTFINTAADQSEVRDELAVGRAPYRDESAQLGLAWTGWSWDIKAADFNANGDLEVVQADGFVQGSVNRWPQLQEMATANDGALSNPASWPNVREGDDIAGHQSLAFYALDSDGMYVNIGEALGLAVPVPTRGIAVGDANGDGKLDLAVARQWDEPIFYRNDGPSGASLGLTLIDGDGAPVVGAQVQAATPDGRTLLTQVDGGNGYTGKRSHEVSLGLGETEGTVPVHLAWRDRDGKVRQDDLELAPGRHTLRLETQAQEVG